jgi:DNA-binding transcriptional ArsR family regulator
MSGDGSIETGDTNGAVGAVEDAFSVLGDETRLQILLELTEVVREDGYGTGLTFSELRTRVGVEDSGRFNYHLNELRDGFVEKVDNEYVAQFPGLAVISAVYAGLYEDVDADEPLTTETGTECQRCSRPLKIHYEGNQLWTECTEHGQQDRWVVPAGAYTNRSLEELANVVYTRLLANFSLARQDICLHCWGQMTIEYPIESERENNPSGNEFIWMAVGCQRCWNQMQMVPLRSFMATHPLVAGPFREHGYDQFETIQKVMRLDNSLCDTELHADEPVSATVRIELEDEELELTVDETCSVTDFERR